MGAESLVKKVLQSRSMLPMGQIFSFCTHINSIKLPEKVIHKSYEKDSPSKRKLRFTLKMGLANPKLTSRNLWMNRVILITLIQLLIGLGKTNNLDIHNSKYSTQPGSRSMMTLLTKNVSEEKIIDSDDHKVKSKISPKSIKFSISKNKKRIAAKSNQMVEPLPSNRTPDLSISDSSQKRKQFKKFIPAYELKPDINARFDELKVNGRQSNLYQNILKNYPVAINIKILTNTKNNLRDLLPKPLIPISGGREVDTQNMYAKMNTSYVQSIRVQHIKDETISASDGRESLSSNARHDIEPSEPYSNHLIEVAESKIPSSHASLLPLFSLDDLDKLYSDALLVYVKDFNEFIV